MSWLYIALAAYFINSVVFIIDKYLLHSRIPSPIGYAFGVSILSSFAILLVPFGINWFGFYYFIVAFLSGLSFLVGLIFLYKAVRKSDVSIASTKIASLSIVFSYIFSGLILNDFIIGYNLLAFILIALGIWFLSRVGKDILFYSIMAGSCFGLSIVLLKLSFNLSDLINGIFWTRVGLMGSGLFLLILKSSRTEIKNSFRNSSRHSKFVFVGNKIIAGLGSVALYYAIKLGNVVTINSILGSQFVFVFFLALLLKNKLPEVKENLNRKVLVSKLTGISLITVGFFLFLVK